MIRRSAALLGLALLGACAPSNPAGEFYDIGSVHRVVTTSSKTAQVWFDRGLAMCFGFNHEEAIRCFDRMIELDSESPMAHWGRAYAHGPHVNNPVMDSTASLQAFESAQRAKALLATATAIERELIEALLERYAWPAPEDRSELEARYAEAMRAVYSRHPDDADIAALFAESLLDLHPWKWWSKAGEPLPEVLEAIAVIEKGMGVWPQHPALNHLYIHAVEMSPDVERAREAADRLRTLVPGAGHLVHMPSHIDVLRGDYPAAIQANQLALRADRDFTAKQGGMNFYTLYRVHNYHFVAYAAMFDGQSQVAMAAARELVSEIPADLLAMWPDFLEAFVGMPLHVMVRFGQWDTILAEPAPPADHYVTTAFWHYARGLAFSSLDRVKEAEGERAAFAMAFKAVPESRLLFNNSATQILGIAESMLNGEVEFRRGNTKKAFAHLREAVVRDDGLSYDEPWGWAQPARHPLGALLMEQGLVDEAARVYREDLARRPNNPWSLHGLSECLAMQGRSTESDSLRTQLKSALARADVEIRGSCYCRRPRS